MLVKKKQHLTRVIRPIILALFFLMIFACSSDDNAISGEPNDVDQVDTPDPIVENPLPRFSVKTNGATIVDEPKIQADFTITEGDEMLYSGKMGIEIRGASSQIFPKKSFGFETWDAEGNDIDVSLLGMPEEEDWILNGPYSDKSSVRNVLIYDLARDMGLYASRTMFVELEINQVYNGIYVFMEKLKRDGERIDINKLKDDENEGEDVTGGYIIKIDKSEKEGYTDQNSFNSDYGSSGELTASPIRFLYDYPKAEDITAPQKTYISTYISDFEDALVSDTFTDPDTGYESYIDVDSFVDFFILNEISNNVDGYRISTYMHKDKNEKLKMGPIWDFNLAFGNADYCEGFRTDVWAYKFNERCPSDIWFVPFWWDRLLQDPAFVVRLKERWNELRGGALADAAIVGKVDGYSTLLNDSGALRSNTATWPTFGVYVWPNSFIGQNYTEEITFLNDWISDRMQWLDTSIDAL